MLSDGIASELCPSAFATPPAGQYIDRSTATASQLDAGACGPRCNATLFQNRRAHVLKSSILTVLALPIACALATAVGAAKGMAQEPEADGSTPPTVAAVRLSDGPARIRIDGVLEDEAWQDAPIAPAFRQREPRGGCGAAARRRRGTWPNGWDW